MFPVLINHHLLNITLHFPSTLITFCRFVSADSLVVTNWCLLEFNFRQNTIDDAIKLQSNYSCKNVSCLLKMFFLESANYKWKNRHALFFKKNIQK